MLFIFRIDLRRRRRFDFLLAKERALRLRLQLAGERLVFPCARGVRFRRGPFRFSRLCGLRGYRRCHHADSREVIIKRLLCVVGSKRFRNGLRGYALFELLLAKECAFRLWLEFAGKRLVFPGARGVRLRRCRNLRCISLTGFGERFEDLLRFGVADVFRRGFGLRGSALRLRYLLRRNLVLRGLAGRLECFIKVRVKGARGVRHRLWRELFAHECRRGRDCDGCRSGKRCTARHHRVKLAFHVRLRHAALVVMNRIIALDIRVVEGLGKLRLRFAFALMRFVAPRGFGVWLHDALTLVRSVAVLHRKLRCGSGLGLW